MIGSVRRYDLLFWFGLAIFTPPGLIVAGEDATGSETIPEVTTEIGDQTVQLPSPTLTGTEDADEQQALIASQLRGLPFGPFVRDSVVAPVRISLSYIKDSQGNRIGHQVHVLFVVHAPLSRFQSKGFSEQVFAADRRSADDASSGFHSEPLSDAQLRELGVEPTRAGEEVRKLQFVLLDQVRLTGLFRFQTHSDATQNRLEIRLADGFPHHWERLESPNAQGRYSGFRAWLTATELTATELKGRDAVLIEARLVMSEPAEWFRGDNYVRSKLPLVLQEAARDLRRRMDRE